jgi:hypothetical protein
MPISYCLTTLGVVPGEDLQQFARMTSELIVSTDSESLGFGLHPSSVILETRKHNDSEIDQFSETLCFLVSGILDDGQSPKTQ